MLNLIARLLAAALLSSACAVRSEQDGDYSWDCPGTGHLPFRGEWLVSTERLADLMEEGRALVVHVDVDEPGGRRVGYADGHLPGARRLKWADLVGAAPGLAPARSRLGLFEAVGITPERPVVFYDTGLGHEAAAAWTALDALGLAGRAAVLDGQWSKWAFEGRPLSMASETGGASVLEPRPAAVAAGKSRRFDPAVTVVDARDDDRIAPVGVRIGWSDVLASPNYPVLKREGDLRRSWAAVPARAEREVLVAARGWVEAAPVYFAARLLGYSARILDGSLEEGGKPLARLGGRP
jgi:3-mercaptopyruvate sulfurtransferase SseA